MKDEFNAANLFKLSNTNKSKILEDYERLLVKFVAEASICASQGFTALDFFVPKQLYKALPEFQENLLERGFTITFKHELNYGPKVIRISWDSKGEVKTKIKK